MLIKLTGGKVYDPANGAWDPLVIPLPDNGSSQFQSISYLHPIVAGGNLYLLGDALHGNDVYLTIWKFNAP